MKFQISGLFIYILHEKSYTMSTGEIDSQRNRFKIQFYIRMQLELEMEIKGCNRRYTGGKKYGEVRSVDRISKSDRSIYPKAKKGGGYISYY